MGKVLTRDGLGPNQCGASNYASDKERVHCDLKVSPIAVTTEKKNTSSEEPDDKIERQDLPSYRNMETNPAVRGS